MRRKAGSKSFEKWLAHSLARDPDLAARVEKRLAEMRIEQDLIALREQRGLTQSQLARLLGVSQPAVAKMEAEGGNLEIRTLVRAAAALDARLEIRLIAERARSSGRPVRPYVTGAVAPAFVHDSDAGYGAARGGRTPTRKRSTRAVSPRRGR
jgi:DNA-binding XRE family transcriptional regulator